jgi:hypothetical protein
MNLLKRNKMGKKYIDFGEHTYRFNLEKIKELCLSSSANGGAREIQIAQTYEVDEDNEMNLLSKVEHETKTFGNSQNDMIIYDIFKIMLVSLLEIDNNKTHFVPTFANALVINTLIEWGILEKIN